MSNPTLIARLGMSTEDFTRGINASQAGLKRLQEDAKVTAAEVALLERAMVGKGDNGRGTAAQAEQLKVLTQRLREVKAEAAAAGKQLAAMEAVNSGSTGGGGAHGMSGGNKGMLNHSARATLEMMMAGQSLVQAAQVEAPKIVQAFGGGLGTMLGVGAGFAVLNTVREHISQTIEKAQELKSAFIDALRPEASRGDAGSSSLRGRLKELDAVIEEGAPKIKFWERMWQRVGDRAHADGVQVTKLFQGKFGEAFGEQQSLSGQNTDLREEAEHRRAEVLEKIVGWEKEANTLKERGLEHGEESVRQAALELEKKQKLAKIEEELGIGEMEAQIRKVESDPTIADGLKEKQLAHLRHELEVKRKAATELQTAAEKEFDLRQKEANRAEFNAQKMVEMEEKLLAIKKEGVDVDVRSAKARLEAAIAVLNAGPKEGVEHDKNQAAVNAVVMGIEDAERGVARNNAQRQIDEDIADNDAPEPIQRRRRLDREVEALNDKNREGSGTYERDGEKRKDIQKEIAQKEAELRTLDRSDKEREFARRENEIEANKRPGTQGQVNTFDAKLSLNEDRQKFNAGGINDPDVASRLSKEAAELHRQKQEILRTEEKTVRVTQEETRELDMQVHGRSRAANEARIVAGYEEKILEAQRNQNSKLVEILQKKQALALLESRIDYELMTPEERGEEAKKNRQRGAAANRIENRDRRKAEANAANASMDPIGALQGRYDNVPRSEKNGTKADEARENTSTNFNAIFRRPIRPASPVAVDRRPQMGAEGAGQSDVAGTDNEGIISAINNPEWAKDLSFKNKA